MENISIVISWSHDSLELLQNLQFFPMEESCLELVLKEDLCLYWSSVPSDAWPEKTALGSVRQSVSCQPVPCREEKGFHQNLQQLDFKQTRSLENDGNTFMVKANS